MVAGLDAQENETFSVELRVSRSMVRTVSGLCWAALESQMAGVRATGCFVFAKGECHRRVLILHCNCAWQVSKENERTSSKLAFNLLRKVWRSIRIEVVLKLGPQTASLYVY